MKPDFVSGCHRPAAPVELRPVVNLVRWNVQRTNEWEDILVGSRADAVSPRQSLPIVVFFRAERVAITESGRWYVLKGPPLTLGEDGKPFNPRPLTHVEAKDITDLYWQAMLAAGSCNQAMWRRMMPIYLEQAGPNFLPLDAQGLEVHDFIVDGIPATDAAALVNAFPIIGTERMCRYLGISSKLHSCLTTAHAEPLGIDASDRMYRLGDTIRSLMEVVGTFDAAQQWLITPAIGLDQRTPLDLLRTFPGTGVVQILMGRMDYGVYS
jgi:putative toxin-antitoxin system antitoxin component (TIGR02293 family)